MKTEQKKLIITGILFVVGIALGFAVGAFGIGLKSSKTVTVEKINTPTPEYQARTASEIVTTTTNFSADIKTLEEVNGVSMDAAPNMGDTQESRVIIVEFSDYQCPFCKKYFDESFAKIRDTYVNSGKVLYAFRDYPLGSHPQALITAEAANCANEQGKFWEMHDMLFGRQEEWSYNEKAREVLIGFADGLKLDIDQFTKCLDSEKYLLKIREHIADGQKYKVTGTPTFFINNKKVLGAQKFETFAQIIESELKKPAPKATQETQATPQD